MNAYAPSPSTPSNSNSAASGCAESSARRLQHAADARVVDRNLVDPRVEAGHERAVVLVVLEAEIEVVVFRNRPKLPGRADVAARVMQAAVLESVPPDAHLCGGSFA